jgi:hypothetical protein
MAFMMESLGSGCVRTGSASCPLLGFDTSIYSFIYDLTNDVRNIKMYPCLCLEDHKEPQIS